MIHHVTEQFFGGNIEHFSNKEVAQKATSMNTILKAVMVTCLFYVLAHKDAKKYLMGKVFKTVKGENYYIYCYGNIFHSILYYKCFLVNFIFNNIFDLIYF